MSTLQGCFIGMFSYGSNNERQLRARVKNPRLSGCPAFLDGYTRVFGSCSPGWGGGGVASVARKKGARVYGCFYLMTPEEVDIVDIYESVKQGIYFKEPVMVTVRMGGGTTEINGGGGSNGGGGDTSLVRDVSTPAMTYIMSEQFASNFVHPTPQYLTAVYRTLTTNFPERSDLPVDVCDYTGSKKSEWTHPGPRGLPLEAFLLEVGLQELPPWTFPFVLSPLAARLAEAGIESTTDLCGAVEGGVLLSKLADARAKADAKNKAIGSGGDGGGGSAATGGDAPPSSEKIRMPFLAGTVLPEFTEQTVAIIARIIAPSAGNGKDPEDRIGNP